jgi:hypothetical protein
MRYLKHFENKGVSFTVDVGDFFRLKIAGYNGVPENIMYVLGEIVKIDYPETIMNVSNIVTFEIMFYRDQHQLKYKEIDDYWFDTLQTSKYYKLTMDEFVLYACKTTKEQNEMIQRAKDANKFGI